MKAVHVTLGNNAYRCLNCGTEFPLPLPMSLNMRAAISKGFTKDHKGCKPSSKGQARMSYKTPGEWVRSWDTGISSMTIYNFMEHGYSERPGVPYDADDFGRCARLLEVTPSWRDRLPAMAVLYPMWKPLVDNWDALTKAFEEKDFEALDKKLTECLKGLR